MQVYPRLVAADSRRSFERRSMSSGVPEFDELLGGGLELGTSTLLMGPAGSGKSTIASQFAASAAKRGEFAAIFIFDEVVNTYLSRAAGVGNDIREMVDRGSISLQQVDPAEMSPGEFAFHVRACVDEHSARVVVIDSINGFLNSMPDENFLTAQLHELLAYLNQQEVITLLILSQHGFLGSNMGTPIDVSYLADNVVLLRYFEAEGAVRRAVSVVKKRTGKHEPTIRELSITSAGLQLGDPLSAFQGVLTGVPTYIGKKGSLSSDDGSK
jgi:circadian clock protein KaiC